MLRLCLRAAIALFVIAGLSVDDVEPAQCSQCQAMGCQ